MSQPSISPSAALFDFTPFEGQSDEHVALIKRFAAALPFRSAVVDELVLDGQFHRRPLRPEDFEFLKFRKPVRTHNVSRLPSLASNRTLLSIYELDIARPPLQTGDAQSDDRSRHFGAYHADEVRVLGAQIAPFLEGYAFDYLSRDTDSATQGDAAAARLTRLIGDELAFWEDNFARLVRNDYLADGLRFIAVQRWALLPSKRHALARAAASGFFDVLPAALHPTLALDHASENLLERVAEAAQITREQHSYWQFYLPTSLAKCNLLYALGRRPDRAFGLIGAAFAAQAEQLAFVAALTRACAHLTRGGAAPDAGADRQRELARRFADTLRELETHYGVAAREQCMQGFAAAERLCERARWDLGEQLRWLSAIERFCEFARRISTRIYAEFPDIDRETFVEPHEMCSTTHVHNDHRLVTIEAGEMLFWGNVGMQLKMNEGDMVLIPDGRLHGSTVVSGECTYHQPIIPDPWVEALMAELDAPVAA
ncbi:peptide synthetase [Burkholderia sp. Ax-1719]|uniref:peptide synthetase n=1 Tax=Burkholderia sp. Ax-1719 TaxID=2608334 RepID=UPI001421E430|nr:peptide synthetase [Burkholderia sp. Ax-1719]NIE64864.1 peptide synthetase [Burkholderia sp. Ax-1719]